MPGNGFQTLTSRYLYDLKMKANSLDPYAATNFLI